MGRQKSRCGRRQALPVLTELDDQTEHGRRGTLRAAQERQDLVKEGMRYSQSNGKGQGSAKLGSVHTGLTKAVSSVDTFFSSVYKSTEIKN